MKWKNLDIGGGYYYLTATCAGWLPLLRRDDVREIVCEEITHANAEDGVSLAAFVLMPEHLHLLTYLPKEGLLHSYCKRWRGRSARRVIDLLQAQADYATLAQLAAHANGRARYAVWKEQPRCLPIVSERKFEEKVDYIHANPVRRRLVANADQWPYSSFRYYAYGEPVLFEIVPMVTG